VGTIGKGTHVRFIVDKERFMAKLWFTASVHKKKFLVPGITQKSKNPTNVRFLLFLTQFCETFTGNRMFI
jgi:hypothetical protein